MQNRAPWKLLLLVMFLQAAVFESVNAAEPAGPDDPVHDPLATLKTSHPRLMVLDDQVNNVQELIAADAKGTGAAEALRQVKLQADKMIDQPPAEHVLVGPRLLGESRKALSVISTCAGMYRLSGEVKYAQRARKEMLAVSAFADWNPSHFLDVAEMTNACGIGYDWIYSQLSPAERTTIRQAILEKGLNPALDAYKKKAFWTDCKMNWGQVCAGGLTVGALAIADEEPALAKHILQLTYPTMAKPMKEFAPDGGWDEGPGYWNYATQYNVFYLSAIESAMGTDFGLAKDPGFSLAPLFHIQLTGPLGKVFNFADAGDGAEQAPQMFWFARKFNQPGYAAWERQASAKKFSIFHLLWFDTEGQLEKSDLPLDMLFKRVNVGVMRSSWTDRNAWYIGFKGGDNAANHSHLDLGSFVLDALGQRWAVDLGPDDYNLPGYFGKERYSYYRLSTRGHNTITINGANQNIKAKAEIASLVSTPNRSDAVIDLSAAYPSGSRVRRGISMIDRKRVLVQDEVELDADNHASYEWNFHTPATVDLDGRLAVLTLKGVKLRVSLLSPEGARFEVTNSDAPAPQKPNTGISNLVVKCNGMTKGPVAVQFSEIDDTTVPPIVPLKDWPVK